MDPFLARRRESDADFGFFFRDLVSGGPDCAGSDGGKREVSANLTRALRIPTCFLTLAAPPFLSDGTAAVF